MFNMSDQTLIAALLDAQQQHTFVKVYLPSGDHPLSSTVLGFDYYEKTILLDALTPPIGKQQLSSMERTPFWLQMKHQDSYLNIYCIVEEFQYDLYTLKILQHEFTDNQRWFSRVKFDARQGPELTLDIPHELPIIGHIRNLSVHGAMAEFYGEDIRDRVGSSDPITCRLRFNELFDITLKAQIKNLTFLRKPSCHSHLRVQFSSHSNVTFSQLQNFIDAFNDTPHQFTYNHSHFQQAHFA